MSLQYIIDGYNIINHPLFAQIHKKIKIPQRALLEFIRVKRLLGSSKNRAIVVFDGYPPALDFKGKEFNIGVLFTKKETADEKIRKIVEASGNPKNIVVVSNDKEIRFTVKSAGAQCIGIEELIGTKEKSKACQEKELLKQELSYSQINAINKELRKIWLK